MEQLKKQPKKKFTKEELKRINLYWKEDRQPEQCIGKCKLEGVTLVECTSCGWDDGYCVP